MPDLLVAVLPMVVSLVMVGLSINWPYRLIYSALLLAMAVYLLLRDDYFMTQVKQLFEKQITLPGRQG